MDVLAQLELQLQAAIFDLLEYQNVGSVKQKEQHNRRRTRASGHDATAFIPKLYQNRDGMEKSIYQRN